LLEQRGSVGRIGCRQRRFGLQPQRHPLAGFLAVPAKLSRSVGLCKRLASILTGSGS